GRQFDYSEIVAPREGDFVVWKSCDDSFFRTELDTLLRNLDVRHLLVAGFAAEACLLATVIGAFHHNYSVVLLRDCCLAPEHRDTEADLALTRWAIRVIESTRGFSTTKDALTEALRR